MAKQIIYTVGGTVQAGGGIYIKRKADDDLLELCRQSEFAFILSSRQAGKSSLIVRTAQQLESENIRSVTIDLSAIGVQVTPNEWYMGILNEIYSTLELKTDVFTWWTDHAKLGPAQRLTIFFKDVLLKEVKDQIILFFDEIDSTLSIPFSDDFYVAIRSIYNARATVPDFKRLSFVLVGVATPSDLISDNKRTPFNIGRRVEINDFNLTEAYPLVENFGIQAAQILTWVFQYTSGHPYLTQRLCAHLAKSKEALDEQSVGYAVERLFTGEQGRQDNNLQFVRNMLSARAPDVRRVLKTYQLIRSGKKVVDDERSVAKAHLKLSGLVRSEKGLLKVRNEIYNRVFNLQWIQENSPRDWQRIALVSLSIPVGVALLVAAGLYISNSIRGFFSGPTPTPVIATVEPTRVISTPTETIVIPTQTAVPPTLTVTPQGTLTAVARQNEARILIPEGEFQMGGVKGDLFAEPHEKPSREVYVDSFYIDKFEVTNAQYQACEEDGGCSPPKFAYFFPESPRRIYYGNPEYDQHPVVYVDWNMANTYCEWRDARLPTEAEWEKAARGTDGRIYPWEGTEHACQIVNYRDCVNRTKRVGFYEGGKSFYGAYDMAGNVWEWVADWYSETYYQISLPTNPLGPDSGLGKVLRGGAWTSGNDDLRTSERRRFPPNSYNLDLGFRCAQDVTP